MAVELRPRTAVFVLLLVLLAGALGSSAVAETVDEPDETSPETVLIDGSDEYLWLLTSQSRSFEHPTLSLNVVVYGDPDDVRRHLIEEGTGDWDETDDEEEDVAPAETAEVFNVTTREWEMADGANRYVYYFGEDGGMWLREAYQIHDGDYLGSRQHVRAYTAPDGGEWTAMQVHHDHWDLFAGRHLVTDVEESQTYLEGEFLHESGAEVVTREYVGGGDRPHFDGWLTVVDLRDNGDDSAGIPLVVGLLAVLLGATRTRGVHFRSTLEEVASKQEFRALALGVAIVSVLLGIRVTAIGVERSTGIPPKSIAALLHPVLIAGIPIVAYLLSRQMTRTWAFTGASLGLVTAILLDYTYLGVTQIPLDVLVHRATLAVALGFIATGGSRTERIDADRTSHVRLGVLLWLVATLHPLLRHTPLPV